MSVRILGVSLGTKNGNNDTICRVALEEAQKQGAEIEFIHLLDWDIKHCTGCVACSRGLVMGKGMVCSLKDDFAAFYEKLQDADGVILVDPTYECGSSGLYHTICDRMGPGHDSGLLFGAHMQLKEQGKEGLNLRYFRQKAMSFIGIGGSDWASCVQPDHATLALSPGWKVVDNEIFMWCKDIIMQDDKIARTQEIARNLVEAATAIKQENEGVEYPVMENNKDYWKGEPGVCPHCHGNNFFIQPGTTNCICELCGLEGILEIVDGSFTFKFDPATEHTAHDIMSGKKLHGDDIFENEGRLINLFKDEEFKRRKEHYTAVCAPTPPPSKA